jgi:NADH dehydrogenase
MAEKTHEVVIVGGGFGGLYAAQSLKHAPVRVTLLDRRNFHLFQPLLYQVATGALSPANIAAPLRSVLKNQKNARVLLAEVIDLDVANRQVVLTDGTIPYDTLILAAGARHHYFGHPEWEPVAPGLKTVEDATEIRRRVLAAFEAAERDPDPVSRTMWLTFVVVGGGPTGVELAGALSELAHHTLRRNFRAIDPATARIILVEGTDRVLPPYPESLSAKARKALERMGIEVWTNALVKDVQPEFVKVDRGGQLETLPAATVLWGAGVQASPLGAILVAKAGAETDRAGRVKVNADLTVPGHPEIFVIGDLALATSPDGKPLPGVAQVAMQGGRYAAKLIARRLAGHAGPAAPFKYWDKGNMATIGRAAAVADLHWVRFSGWPAWLAWLFIHILFIITFENRVLILFQWFWNYLTRNRSARLITGPKPAMLKGAGVFEPSQVGHDGGPVARSGSAAL